MENYYDDTKITEKILRMARKVKMDAVKIDKISEKYAPDLKQEHWQTNIEYKGRKFEAVYMLPVESSPEPRVEYVLNSLFANAAIYDRYKDKGIFEFINDFPRLAADFKSTQEMYESIAAVASELRTLFKDDYEQYRNEFVKLNAFDRIF